MKGDFTRDTFDPRNHFTRVLMQQGRVQIDADWNEQAAILLHYLQTLAADLIGPHGGPMDNCGFGVVDVSTLSPDEKDRLERLRLFPLQSRDFLIGKGHYYVDGVLCENEDYKLYSGQPDWSPEFLNLGTYLVYLVVWERHITYIQDNSIQEVALGGPDTATRAKLVWQVKTCPLGSVTECNNVLWDDLVEKWQPTNRGQLKARAKMPEDSIDPCITSPEAHYRGTENQLYRVEIHRRGNAWDGEESTKANSATFKWSRDNGSVVLPIRNIATDSTTDTTTVTLEHLGRDTRFSLQEGDWVEIVDDDYVLQGRDEPLLKVSSVDRVNMHVALEGISGPQVGHDPTNHPMLRRWDHKAGDPSKGGLDLHDGAAIIKEGVDDNRWLKLEDGVQICFKPVPPNNGNGEKHLYRTGDYWLIPARTATGDVEWPQVSDDGPQAVPPDGVEHHYAPLAIISIAGEGKVSMEADCRNIIEPIGKPIQ